MHWIRVSLACIRNNHSAQRTQERRTTSWVSVISIAFLEFMVRLNAIASKDSCAYRPASTIIHGSSIQSSRRPDPKGKPTSGRWGSGSQAQKKNIKGKTMHWEYMQECLARGYADSIRQQVYLSFLTCWPWPRSPTIKCPPCLSPLRICNSARRRRCIRPSFTFIIYSQRYVTIFYFNSHHVLNN